MNYQEATDKLQFEFGKILHDRFESKWPDAFAVCNERDPIKYAKCNRAMYSWYMKLCNSIDARAIKESYQPIRQIKTMEESSDYSIIDTFIEEFNNTEDWVSFLVGKITLK